MFDAFDILAGAFAAPAGPKGVTPGEKVAAVLGQLIFPAGLFCVVLFLGLWKHGTAVVVLTVGLMVAGFVISRLLSQRLSFALANSLLSAVWILLAAGSGYLLGALVGFYEMF